MTAPVSFALNESLSDSAPAEPRHVNSILVATDGTDESDAAVRLAHTLAVETGAKLHAISVCESFPTVNDWPRIAPIYIEESADVVTATRSATMTAQVSRLLGAAANCPVAVTTGVIATEIAAYAAKCAADLIVTGRGRHGIVARLLGEEHLVKLLRTAPAPVLAVDSRLVARPKRVVIAVDFSQNGLAMARSAMQLIDDNAVVYLVHVKPDPPFGIPHPGQWIKSYEHGVRAGLREWRDALALPATCVVEPIVLNGHPGVEIAEFAERSNSDLIAIGVHGSGFFNRLVIGSVTTYLLREAPCSLFVVPAP